MTAYVFATERRQAVRSFLELGVVGWLAALVNGLSMICYLAALRHTSVANVTVIYATAPVGAAAIAWLAYRDRASTRTLLAGLSPSPALRSPSAEPRPAPPPPPPRRRQGGSARWWRCRSPLTRRRGTRARQPRPVRDHELRPRTHPLHDRRAVPAHPPRTALISTLDTPLAPLWVWVAFNERPALTTVVGGVIIPAVASPPSPPTSSARGCGSLSSVEAQS